MESIFEPRHDLACTALELLQVVGAGAQDDVLNPCGLQVADPFDDLVGGAEEVRLPELLERPMPPHDALEDGSLESERFVTIRRVHQVNTFHEHAA